MENSTPVAAGVQRPKEAADRSWPLIVVSALVMLATFPARTQGLGLITEPLLADLKLERLQFATMNLWASLIGALFCFPAGWCFDRWGLRWPTALITLMLAGVVWALCGFYGTAMMFVLLLTLTRGLGQSALSVASITAVGKKSGDRPGTAMALFSVLVLVFFAIGFLSVGHLVRTLGWRTAWGWIACFLLVPVLPLICLVYRGVGSTTPDASPADTSGLTLTQSLRTPAFWAFAGSAALFNLVSSGLGLFNEAVLAERGFDQKTFHTFLALTTLLSLVGQGLCGWACQHISHARLNALALAAYAIGLALIPLVRTQLQLFGIALLAGISGGMIIVVFFAIWSHAFGRRHLGRIQGAAQAATVIFSALGPVLFANAFARDNSYTPLLLSIALAVAGMAWVLCKVKLPPKPL